MVLIPPGPYPISVPKPPPTPIPASNSAPTLPDIWDPPKTSESLFWGAPEDQVQYKYRHDNKKSPLNYVENSGNYPVTVFSSIFVTLSFETL